MTQNNNFNFFIRLKDYSDSEHLTQTENYLSTLFTGLLNADLELGSVILKYMFKRDFHNYSLEVQRYIGEGCIPDIFITDEDKKGNILFYGAIECKVDSEPDEEQVLRYEKRLRLKYPYVENKVVFLGENKPVWNKLDSKNIFDWIELSDYFKRSSDNYPINYLRKEFYKFLKNNYLIMPSPIILNKWSEAGKIYFSSIMTIEYLFEHVTNKLKTEKVISGIHGKRMEKSLNDHELQYYGTHLESIKNIKIGIYFTWRFSEYNIQNLGLCIYLPEQSLASRNDKNKIDLDDGRTIQFKDKINEWYSIGCNLNIDEDNDKTFWDESDIKKQGDYLFNLTLEILRKSDLI